MATQDRNESTTTVSSRLSRLESTVEALAQEVHSITGLVRTLSSPDWSNYLRFAAVLLTIVGLVGGAVMAGYSSAQSRLDASVTRLTEKSFQTEFDRGHRSAQLDAVREHARELDVNLQREMRDVNARTQVAVDALDRRLQDEISRASRSHQEAEAALRAAVQRGEGYRDSARPLNAGQDERLRALERAAFEAEGKP